MIPEILQAQVSMKLVSYIEGNVDSATFIFKLSEFHVLYENHLHELGIQKAVNRTRLKTNYLLSHFGGKCNDESDGKNTRVAFGTTGKRFRYYSLYISIQSAKLWDLKALPSFMPLLAVILQSQFHGKGKKSAWDAWKAL